MKSALGRGLLTQVEGMRLDSFFFVFSEKSLKVFEKLPLLSSKKLTLRRKE